MAKDKNFRTPTNGHYVSYMHQYQADQILKRIPPLIYEKLEKIDTYQKEWDSDDNDDKVKKYYDTVVEAEYKLHTTE